MALPPPNFLQWNPNANNQENDAAFAVDPQRLNGAVAPSLFASVLANKVLYQSSTFLTALAAALYAKGFSMQDGAATPATAVSTLQSVLSNILTTVDIPGPVVQSPIIDPTLYTAAAAVTTLQNLVTTFYSGGVNVGELRSSSVFRFTGFGFVQAISGTTASLIFQLYNNGGVVTTVTATLIPGSNIYGWTFDATLAYLGAGNYLLVATFSATSDVAGNSLLNPLSRQFIFNPAPGAGPSLAIDRYQFAVQFSNASSSNSGSLCLNTVQSLN